MITVYCDKGHKPWTVAKFALRSGDGWRQVEAASNALKLEQRRYTEAHGVRSFGIGGGRPASADKPLSSQAITSDGQATGLASARMIPSGMFASGDNDAQAPLHTTFTMRCEPCQRKRRHSTFTRREDKLWPILDRLRGNGIDRITLDGMARAAGLIDTEGRTAESE